MIDLSQNDRNIIAEHPLDKYLDHLRDPLRKAEQNYRPSSLSYDGVVDRHDQGLVYSSETAKSWEKSLLLAMP
jgi:hypothetical protein